jgi:hypothetical protein
MRSIEWNNVGYVVIADWQRIVVNLVSMARLELKHKVRYVGRKVEIRLVM